MSTFGSKRLVVGAHYGLRDWLGQSPQREAAAPAVTATPAPKSR